MHQRQALRRVALLGLLGCAAATALTPARSATAGPPPAFVASAAGFRAVLAYGEGQTTSATDLALNTTVGTVPPSFTDQAPLYNAVITRQPTSDAALSGYYADTSFRAPVSGSTVTVAGARIVRDDAHHIPHIYAPDRASAMVASGYATAQDRLFLMDVLRRTAEGSTAELLGPSAASADSAAVGQFDLSPAQLTAEVEALPQTDPQEGAQALADLTNYVAGINAYIAATRTDPRTLPAEYPALGTLPRTWTLADTAAEAYLLIAQFTVAGDGEEKQADIAARLRARLGATLGAAVYADLRNLENPSTPTTASRPFPSDDPGPVNPAANAHLDAASITARNAVVSTSPGLTIPPVAAAGLPAWARTLAAHGLRLPREASNALLIAGRHTASGHPVAAMGPQVGYYSPEILVEQEIHAPGVQVAGMTFPGASPFPLIGHGLRFAWTGTTALGDNADTFAELLCSPSGGTVSTATDYYRYRGQCVPFSHRDQVLHTPLAPTAPTTLPQTITLRTANSVHGPVFGYATVGGAPVALVRAVAVTGRGIRSLGAFQRLAENEVDGPASFVAVMRHFTGNENWFYVDSAHIAWLASGWFPRHARGVDTDLPAWGTGPYDWVGFNPATGAFDRRPDATNPTQVDGDLLVSWNNKGAPGWHAAPGTWSFGRVQRVQLLADPARALIRAGHPITLADAVAIAGNASTQDLRAVAVLPDLLQLLGTPAASEAPEVSRLRSWLAAGAHRRDTTGSGYDDSSAAVLVFDDWWRRVVHAVFEPTLGVDVMRLVSTDEDLVVDGRPVATGFFDGWHSQLSADLRRLEGSRAAGGPSRSYCGGGTVGGCRSLLRSTLAAAVAAVAQAQGSTDPARWRKPVLCPQDSTPSCDENRPITAGAIATPSQPFENRGTFHQAVELTGATAAGAAAGAATAGGAAGAAPAGGRLAVTGGGPGLPGLASLAAGAVVVAVLTRRRVSRAAGGTGRHPGATGR